MEQCIHPRAPGLWILRIFNSLWSHNCDSFFKKTIFYLVLLFQLTSIQSLSPVQPFAIQWTAAHQASLSITNTWSLLKLMSIESVILSSHLFHSRPLLLLPSIFPSIRVFSNESVLCIRWPKYWSFSFSISPSNEYSGLIYFSIDWFDLLVVQGNLKGSLPHCNTKTSTFST